MNRLAQSNSTSLLSELRGPAPGVMTFREGLPFAGLPPPPPLARGVLKSSCESPPSVIFNPESEEKFDTTVHSDFLSAPHLFYTLNELVVLSPPPTCEPRISSGVPPQPAKKSSILPGSLYWDLAPAPPPSATMHRLFLSGPSGAIFQEQWFLLFYAPSSLPFLSPSPRFYAG